MKIGVTNSIYYKSIADAIRSRKHNSTKYRPCDMAAAILAIPDNSAINIYDEVLKDGLSIPIDSYYKNGSMSVIRSNVFNTMVSDVYSLLGQGREARAPTASVLANTIMSHERMAFPTATSMEPWAFAKCLGLEEVRIPKLTKVPTAAFYGCSDLSSVYFPSLQSISANAFEKCTALREISFPLLTRTNTKCFADCPNLFEVFLPKCTGAEREAFKNCGKLEAVFMPKVTGIGSEAFANCGKVSKLYFPVCVRVYSYAFQSCSSLTEIKILSMKGISDYAFKSCSNLRIIDVPLYGAADAWDPIFNSTVFEGCSNLEKVYRPDFYSGNYIINTYVNVSRFFDIVVSWASKASLYILKSTYENTLSVVHPSRSYLKRIVYMERPSALTIDDHIDSSSINPVANNVIVSAFRKKVSYDSPHMTGTPTVSRAYRNTDIKSTIVNLGYLASRINDLPNFTHWTINSVFCASLSSVAGFASPSFFGVPKVRSLVMSSYAPVSLNYVFTRVLFGITNKIFCIKLSNLMDISGNVSCTGIPTVPEPSEVGSAIATTRFVNAFAGSYISSLSSLMAWKRNF